MKITAVDVYGYDVSYVDGAFELSGGRVVETLPSTVVRLTTDAGAFGFGETCPLGSAYLPAHGEGARAALRELGPAVLALDPRDFGIVNDVMDTRLLGHAYAKAPSASLLGPAGRAAGVPVTTLLGGRRLDGYRSTQRSARIGGQDGDRGQASATLGVQFQLKVRTAPHDDAARVHSFSR